MSRADGERRGLLAWLLAVPAMFVEALRPERLPDAPAATGDRGGGFFRWLFGSERLPELPPPDEARVGFFSWLAASEPLPELPTEPRQPSALRWLLAPERLPEPGAADPSAPPHAPGFWRWLLAPERLDARDTDSSSRDTRP